METLIPALVAVALAEAGGRMQRLAAALSRRYRRPGAVLAGLFFAAASTMGVGAAAGLALRLEIPHSAARLLVGVALCLAGIGGLFRTKPAPDLSGWRLGPLLFSFGAAAILGFGEGAQFVAAGLAAAGGEGVATAIGATIGATLACAPPVLLADRWDRMPALALIRIGASVLLGVAGAMVALLALQIA